MIHQDERSVNIELQILRLELRKQRIINMKDSYTRDEAMKLLDLKSTSAFLRLERRYPEAFVVVNRAAQGKAQYDKAMFDRFVRWRKQFKQERS